MRPQLALAMLLAATAAHGQWSSLSDFESATAGPVDGQEGWTTTAGNTTAFYDVTADPSDPTNQALRTTGTTGSGDMNGNAYISLGGNSIADGTTGTLFWRMRNSDLGDLVVGAIDVADPAIPGWGGYEGYMVQGNAGGGNVFKVRDGGGFANLDAYTADEWYNVWLVLDHTADNSSLYVSQGADPAVLLGAGDFRTGNEPDDTLTGINIRMGAAQLNNNAIGYVDDFYVDASGVNLSNPVIPEPTTAVLAATLLGATALRRRS